MYLDLLSSALYVAEEFWSAGDKLLECKQLLADIEGLLATADSLANCVVDGGAVDLGKLARLQELHYGLMAQCTAQIGIWNVDDRIQQAVFERVRPCLAFVTVR